MDTDDSDPIDVSDDESAASLPRAASHDPTFPVDHDVLDSHISVEELWAFLKPKIAAAASSSTPAVNGTTNGSSGVKLRIPVIQPITMDEFDKKLWPTISDLTTKSLENVHFKLAYQELYTALYKASGRLTCDVLFQRISHFFRDYCIQMRQFLAAFRGQELIYTAVGPLFRYFHAAPLLKQPYSYAEKVVIFPKKKITFDTYVLNKLRKHTIEHPSFKPQLLEALSTLPMSFLSHVDSGEMKGFINGLHKHFGYSSVNMQLFTFFVPGLIKSGGYEADLAELRLMWPAIVASMPDPRKNNPLKRKIAQASLSEARIIEMDVDK